MFTEILWIVASFSWGLIRLLQTLKIDDHSSSDWSFGQVVPLVLLTAPLLTIFESFFKVHSPNKTLSIALVQFHTGYSQIDSNNVSLNTPPQAHDHPDCDFYPNSLWSFILIGLMATHAVFITIVALWFSRSGDTRLVLLLIPTSIFPSYLPIYIPLSIWLCTMFSMLWEDTDFVYKNGSKSLTVRIYRWIVWLCLAAAYVVSIYDGELMTTMKDGRDQTPAYYLCAGAASYCVLSFGVHVIAVRHGNVPL